MLRCIFATFLAVFLCLAARSQEIVLKPSVGLNFTNFSKQSGDNKYSAQLGYQAGGSVSFGGKFYIEPGAYYIRKSTNYSTSSPDSSYLSGSNKGNFKLSGLYVPVSIGYSILGGERPSDPVGLRIFGGGSAFVLTAATPGQLPDFKKTQWGVFAGLGLDIGILFIEGKYEWSLTNLQRDVSLIDVGKTRSIFINAGVRIPLGRE